MTQSNIKLEDIFHDITQTLAENQTELNQADDYNHDHGNNMVQTFQLITNALMKKKGSSDSAALRYAAQQLSKQTSSGSGKLYAENLTQAANQFKGRQVDSRGAFDLLQTLIGAGQSEEASTQTGGDLLSTILGMSGGLGGSGQQQTPTGSDNMLGELLGDLTGSGSQSTQQSSQSGTDPMAGLLGSLMGGGASSTQQPGQSSGSGMLGALLSGLAGSGETSQHQTASGGGDMLGELLGGLVGGGGSSATGQGGPDLGNLLNAAMAFFQAKQSGGNTLQALMQAFMAANRMGDASHRSQSTQLVIESFLNALQK